MNTRVSEGLRASGAIALLAALALGVSGGCGGESTWSQGSTETGNPPLVSPELIDVVVVEGGLLVKGAPGAVEPGGTEVEIRSGGSGSSARVTADSDGGFSVVIDAQPGDPIAVSAVGYPDSNQDIVGGSGASCEDLRDAHLSLTGDLRDLYDTPSARACTTADDCAFRRVRTTCDNSCAGLIVSASAAAAISEGLASISEGLCEPLVERDCPTLLAGNACSQRPETLGCLQDTCVDCDACFSGTLSWEIVGVEPAGTLRSCNTFEWLGGGTSCTHDLPGCAPAGEASVQGIVVALQSPDVQAAFSEGGLYGTTGPTTGDLRVTYEGESIDVGNGCPEDAVDCRTIPDGVTTLTDLLRDLDRNYSCLRQ